MKISIYAIWLIALLPYSIGRAGLTYSVGFESSNYEAGVGGQTQVRVFFREMRDNNSVAKMSSSMTGDGLFGVGFRLDFSQASPNGASLATLNSFQLNSLNTAFDPNFSTVPTSASHFTVANANKFVSVDAQARSTEGIEVPSFVQNGRDVFQVEIGTFTFTNTGPVGTVTTLKLSNSPIPFANLFADGGEPASIAFGTATITAVPEPSTLILVGLAACSPGVATWRKRRRKGVRLL